MGRETGWYWTPARVVAAAQVFAEIYGRQPSYSDFNPSRAQRDQWERYHSDGCWPSGMTVNRHCGSWNAMIAAAGFEPNAPGTMKQLRHDARRDSCVNGHEFTPENTAYRKSNGSRICIECRNAARQASYDRLYKGAGSRRRRRFGETNVPRSRGGRPKQSL